MNHARLESSHRLQRLAEALADGHEHSTLDLAMRAGICAVNSAVAELRANGYDIECRRQGEVWLYRLHTNTIAKGVTPCPA
jgi:biotin operon repressor